MSSAKMLKVGILCLCWAATLATGVQIVPGIDDIVPVIFNSTTTAPKTSTTPIPQNSTTEVPQTTTTPAPQTNTTSAPPTTTTSKPPTTTTSAPPTTTTSAPPTTTSKPPTTTTSKPPTSTTPAPVPAPTAGMWTVNGTNATCIVIEMAVQFNISYTTKDQNETYQEVDLPADNKTLATGVCGSLEQNLTLSWNTSITVNNSLTLHFVQNSTTKQYSLHHLEVILDPQNFPNIITSTPVKLIHEPHQFSTSLSNSYRCLKVQSLNLTAEGHNETVGFLKIDDLQFQAFRGDNSTTFGFAEDCAFDTPDIVPIAVGCALAVLVVIVLVAYLVGRRRNQARGYLSM
ncbi:lysosome-associated membrane glycoprotein 1 [Cephus cinctus]|uniref:Lysosome-associated membrane glycoprotein 5 n=1 Tax=Cephus cinctus TaxID=211228 RepID=A0AAJ7CD16_CEPCN|nr:lysosome-associated membrane glycoprotein 1 [Cephus cinctus]